MPSYRLYFLNEQGRILRADNIIADHDDAARRTARLLDHSFEIEIWEQSRKVDSVRTEK